MSRKSKDLKREPASRKSVFAGPKGQVLPEQRSNVQFEAVELGERM